MLAHSVAAFESHPRVGAAVVVLHPDSVERGRELAREMGWGKVAAVVPGGGRRQDSVAAASTRCLPPGRWVLVHDGARPCVTGEVIDRGIDAAEQCGAAVAATPVKDTIKVVDADGIVVRGRRTGRRSGRSRRRRSSGSICSAPPTPPTTTT